jgi:protein-serine/threonine kinase
MYDARKTDAWACGVVLYALVGRVLPFGEGAGQQANAQKIGGERGGEQRRGATPAERRHWLMRIARGEWTWPGVQSGEQEEATALPSDRAAASAELVGARLVQSLGARRIVGRLLVRDPRKRARIADLWDDAWMRGGGEEGVWWRGREREAGKAESKRAAAADAEMLNLRAGDDAPTWDGDAPEFWKDSVDVGFYDVSTGLDGLSEKDAARWEGAEDGVSEEVVVIGEEGEEELEEEELEEEEEEGGCLFDQEGIDSITRQEVI